ncbi:substrate-binding periplasmic protein [Psychromonas aquimarina]|uniref:substrate-binding periplasmic protein n=1 Tax=Psychromonas aquimarina TaxID=444919 RepID=UPI0003FFDD40|nr:transporter substrate-binding domain-containing protein [Psychromonas aquimarina]
MKRLILLCLLFLNIGWNSVFAQQALVLATVNNFPPFNYMQDDVLTGIDIDIVKEMAKRLNLEIKITSAPWKAVMHHIETGRVDGGFAAFMTPERQQFSLYTAPLHDETMYLFMREDNQFPFTSLHDLDGKIIAKENGAFISDAFTQAINTNMFTVHEGDNVKNLKMLEINRLDAVIGHLEVMQHHLNTLKLNQQIFPQAPIGEKQSAYLILSKKSKYPNIQKLQQEIKIVLEEMHKDGTYQRISSHHLMK